MQTERLQLRFSDGRCEWHDPPNVPALGAIIQRAGHRYVVAAVEAENDGVIVAVLRRAPNTAHQIQVA